MRPDLAKKLEPSFTGWIGHENPFGFEIGATRYTPSIYRFTQGTPNIPALKVAQPGLKIVSEVGVETDSRKIEAADGDADGDGRQARLEGEHTA